MTFPISLREQLVAVELVNYTDTAGTYLLRRRRNNAEAADTALAVFREWLRDEADDIAAHHEGERGNRHRPIVKHLRWLADTINEELSP